MQGMNGPSFSTSFINLLEMAVQCNSWALLLPERRAQGNWLRLRILLRVVECGRPETLAVREIAAARPGARFRVLLGVAKVRLPEWIPKRSVPMLRHRNAK
jgi:hypothetical protein